MNNDKFSNVCLMEEIIFSCANFFLDDALIEFKEKLKNAISNAKGLILPVYCNDDEEDNFWLFYCSNSVENLQETCEKDKITGYWLDHESNKMYRMLKEEVTLVGENIIKHDSTYFFELYEFEDETQIFELNKWFEMKINNVLSEQGYI